MATADVNGVRLFYELSPTAGIPLVLVHGAWSSHDTWDRVAPQLAESFRLLTYDRRGHSQSERPAGQGSVREDVADLAALIEHLGLAPAWVAGSSAGAAITLRLAGARPDLLHGVIGHEPGFFALLADDPTFDPVLEETDRLNRAVTERITAGDHAGAAEHFIETVVGTGAWERMPPAFQQTLIGNAPTFLDDINDPEHFVFDLDSVTEFSKPALLTKGDQSPPFFAPVLAKLAAALPNAEVVTFEGAGHTPYSTHPDDYVDVLTAFIRKHSE
jgi:pimeloyl-ACP methyl ester carboxylesterase